MLGALFMYLAKLGSPCAGPKIFGFPTWYAYLPGERVNGMCSPSLGALGDIWLIVAALIEILLHIAGIAAVVFVIVGAISYVTSQGEPDKTAKARDTIVNALVGLAIAITSAAIVGFVAGRVK